MKFVDTSVLVMAERDPEFRELLFAQEILIPAIAAAELLVGVKLVKSERLRNRGQEFYEQIRPYVHEFDASQAQTLAAIIVTARRKGIVIKAYDAAIAAAAMEYGCSLIVADGDFDDIDGLEIEKIAL